MKHMISLFIAIFFLPSLVMVQTIVAGADQPNQNYVVCAPQIIPAQSQEPLTFEQMIENDEKETQRILITFFSMVGNFVNILKDPKNPCVVGAEIARILTGLVAIGMEAFNKSIPLDDEQDLEKYLLDEEFLQTLKEHFIAYAEELKQAELRQMA